MLLLLVVYIVQFVWALAESAQGKVTLCLALDYLIVRIHVLPLECPPLTPLPVSISELVRSLPLIGRGRGEVTRRAANERRRRAGRRESGRPTCLGGHHFHQTLPQHQPLHQIRARTRPFATVKVLGMLNTPVFLSCKKI